MVAPTREKADGNLEGLFRGGKGAKRKREVAFPTQDGAEGNGNTVRTNKKQEV